MTEEPITATRMQTWLNEWSSVQSAAWKKMVDDLTISSIVRQNGYAVGNKLRAKFPDDYQWRIAATPVGKLTYEEHVARRGFPQRNLIRRIWMVL